MARLAPLPTGEIAKAIATTLCATLNTLPGKRAPAYKVRAMVLDAAAVEGYTERIGTARFIGWLRSLGILYGEPYRSWYGLRKDWQERLETADWDTEPGKWGSLRPEYMPRVEEG